MIKNIKNLSKFLYYYYICNPKSPRAAFLILLSITLPSNVIIFSITIGYPPPKPLLEDTVGILWNPVPLVNGVGYKLRFY